MTAETATSKSTRALDPNVLQRRAAAPQNSIWVNASAGTGKTKVLTDRVLRLLLPREAEPNGTPAHKILGLTFTKAGASEMALRINETLGQWAVIDEQLLQQKLQQLLGRTPNDNELKKARRLFAEVIDTPDRLKIMTIHSFCQSLLSRFPLEAQLTPGFKLIEEREAKSLTLIAKNKLLHETYNGEKPDLKPAFDRLLTTFNEDQLFALLTAIINERGQFKRLIEKHFGIDGLYTALCAALNIQPNESIQSALEHACQNHNEPALKSLAATLGQSKGKRDQAAADKIITWLTAPLTEKITTLNTYKSAYLTQAGTISKQVPSKALREKHPDLHDAFTAEAERLLALAEHIKSVQTANFTRDICILGDALLQNYAATKTQQNALDFEDLIFKSLTLLKSQSEWVQFKLDEGIDHILIDEAQDTNPEQWQIIQALSAEFFAAHSQSETPRTIFTVGDDKQSIYSFQRASPEEFARMQSHFADKITAANQGWGKIDLNISFRSLQCVLDTVDAVFNHAEKDLTHHAFRRGQAGCVELWPLSESDEAPKTRTWEPPTTITEFKSGASKLADKIAAQIRQWLDTGEQLESHNRPIQAGDIMILVRTRNAFVNQLIRALKLQNIPVGGLDRIILNDQIAVQDLLAAATFGLLPSDDYTLACLLKSPLIGMDEDALFDITHNRDNTLFSAILTSQNTALITYLKQIERDSRALSPYAFFAKLLHTPCPADPISGLRAIQSRLGIDALDALDELLNTALNYETQESADLQQFLHWQRSGNADIKRQSDEQSNHVRIMTTHGSKGLQAPIVFLPDTTAAAGGNNTNTANRLLWPSQSGLNLPLLAPRKDHESALYAAGKDTIKERMEEEYRRLLYVAMTRAEDRLYIAGYTNKRPPADGCWYRLCDAAMRNMDGAQESENGTLRYSAPQSKDPDRHSKETSETSDESPLPDWLYNAAPAEPQPPAPLVPSRPSEIEPAATSPLSDNDQYRFRRGNLTHTLLQFLPDIPPQNRENAAQAYLDNHAGDLTQNTRGSILRETLNILNHPDFTAIFGPDARAEVPITGLLPDGRLISGQIDRLLITETEILIIDYKTNRPPPTDPKDIPAIYRNQMRAYADTLREIYPTHAIRCALLWTDTATLMPINSIK
ncbi:MAG: double-strand break repair helicase AddA [Alphaproteobacteria bacterium]